MKPRPSSLYSMGAAAGGGAVPPDLTAPIPPVPVSLASGSTSLGSTSIGSWSASVTVTATVTASSGSPPTATVTGSGAGPYSVSIASGLADGRTYAVTLTGTGADGQVARVGLSLAVANPTSVTGSINWVVAADYDYTQVVTSSAVTSPGTVASGNVALPDLTLATDNAGTYSVTPTAGTGMALSSTGTARPYVYFVPNWSGIGIDTSGPDGYAVEMQVSSPVQASSSFFTYFFGSAANPNGSGSGSGGRCLNTAGTRNIIARSVSAGTAELGATIASQASDFASLSFFAAALPGEVIGSGLGSALPAGPSSYTAYRDGYARSLSTAWGLSPGNVALLFGGANISGNLTRIRIWKRGVS
jgi:hypothetical protein